MATLLVEYLVKEASSGQGPTQLLDSQGNLPMNITYNGAKPQFVNIPAGDGLSFDYSGVAKAQSASAAGTPLQLAYGTGTIQQATYIGAFKWINAPYYIAALQYNDANLFQYGFGFYATNFNGDNACSVTTETTSGYCESMYLAPADNDIVVMIVSVDTTEVNSASRVTIRYNNVVQYSMDETTPGLNSYLSTTTTNVVTTGLDEGIPAPSSTLLYGAYLSGLLTSGELASVTASLLANNNVSPFGAAPVDNAAIFGMHF